MEKNPAPAKITRPKLAGIFSRKRLFKLLDQGRNKPVTWVASPAGSGKTTLVASWLDSRKLPCLWYQVDAGDGDLASFFYYLGQAAKRAAPRYKQPLPLLAPEYLQAVPVFTRRYFETLFSRFRSPAVIVFDNYQDAPRDSGFHTMMADALETVPDGIRIIILSRNAPAPQLARLQANNRVHIIGWEEVRFTPEESGELLKAQGQGTADRKTVALLHEKTEGWAAGLVLLIARKNIGAPDEKSFDRIDPSRVFDYFASEILEKADGATRLFLLKTSFLPRVDAALAERLTGNSQAGQILDRLNRDHYFTYKQRQSGNVYQYHPLFREFLAARAASSFSQTERFVIQRTAAKLLADAGQIEDAVPLLRDGEDWQGLISLIRSHAQTLVKQGRSSTLEEWIVGIPPERTERTPWLLYWLAACRLAHDPGEARGYLEKAFPLFERDSDMPGLFLTWASIIDTLVYAWSDFRSADHWIEVAYRLIAEHPVYPSPEIEAKVASGMFSIMFWGRPQHPDLPEWAERLSRIVLNGSGGAMRLGLDNSLLLYYKWIGDFSKAAIHFEVSRKASRNLDSDPLALQWWWGLEAGYSWMVADHETCVAAIANGIRLGEETGMHLLDTFLLSPGIYSGVSMGHPEFAEELLQKMEKLDHPRTIDKALYHYLAASVKWYRGNFAEALEYGKQALQFSLDSASQFPEVLSRLELAVTLFDMGRRTEAGDELARALVLATGLKHIEFVCRMFNAWFAFQQGDEEGGAAALRGAMTIGAEQRYVNFARWRPEMMSALCAKALEYGIETEYAVHLIRRRSLAPPESAPAPATWPYPVKICTLGRFEVRKDEKPVPFAGKKKQLELLKVLIALGVSSIREEQATDVLWPDAEGDDAHNSFKVTLSRLRGLIGNESVLHEEGLYSLNAGTVRIDAADFERCSEQAIRLWARGGESRDAVNEALGLTGKALELYRGNFLPDDASCAWTASIRERLRSKLQRLTLAAGSYYEGKRKWKTALGYYEKGLEADALQEEFYLRCMICHQKLGQRAELIAVYRRCRSELSALGITPSRKTVEIYESVK